MCEGKGITLCILSFPPNGAGAIVQASILSGGAVFDIQRTGPGVYKVQFNERYATYLGAVPGLALSALADTDIQYSGFTPAAGTTRAFINVLAKTAGVAADIAANAANRITSILVFSYNEKIV
jgi:hypothetical protein